MKKMKKSLSVTILTVSLALGSLSAFTVPAAAENGKDTQTDVSIEEVVPSSPETAEDEQYAAEIKDDIRVDDLSEPLTVGDSGSDENETGLMPIDDESTPDTDSDDDDITTPEIDISTKIDISKASVAGVSLSYGYSGKPYTPALKVIVSGRTLSEGRDYTVVYSDNTDPGTATITITGKGSYKGKRIKHFDIVDCVSSLVSGKTYMLIPKNNSKTAVCSFSGRMVNNTKVYITDRSSSEAMRFIAKKNNDGTWKFINAKCELALAVQQNSTEVGKGLVLYQATTRKAQNWKLERKSDNSFAIINSVTDYSVAMSDLSAAKGTTLSMAVKASDGLQRFYIVETDPVDNRYDGIYAVKAAKDKTFSLNIAQSSSAEGANVNLYKYSGSSGEKFMAVYSGGGYYRLLNLNSGLAVSVSGNTKANGTNVCQSAWAAQSGQRWKISKNSDGTVTFTNALGTVLHLVSNSTKNNSNIVARAPMSTKAQSWYLTAVS